MKNCLSLSGQTDYHNLIEQILIAATDEDMDFDVFNSPEAVEQLLDHYEDNVGKFNDIPPVGCLPRIYFEKESKMKWAFEERPTQVMIDSFRGKFQRFLAKYAPKEIFVCPSSATMKTGDQKFNDDGVIKLDHEVANNPDCGFLYQKFVTQPLQIRECWLPSKALKTNSTGWFEIVKPFFNNIPYALYGKTSEEIAEILQPSMGRKLKGYDFFAYGLQYPREYLVVMGEEIAMLYPSVELTELTIIMTELLKAPSVTMPDGKVLYPPRGIGLGYYETLKTLGTMAILDEYCPVAVWGDEGLLPIKSFKAAMISCKTLGFFENTEKRQTYNTENGLFWAGMFLSRNGTFSTCSEYWLGLNGSWGAQTHHERKSTFCMTPTRDTRTKMIFAYCLEKTYGFEFFRGECFSNHLNGGMMGESNAVLGHDRSANILALLHMKKEERENYLFYYKISAPRVGENIKLSLQRRKAWKQEPRFTVTEYLTLHPRTSITDSEIPRLDSLARTLPSRIQMRLLLWHRLYTERLTFGYTPEEMYNVFSKYSGYSDPLRASVSKVSYRYHIPKDLPVLTEERETFVDLLCQSTKIEDSMTRRADTMSPYDIFMRYQREYYRSKGPKNALAPTPFTEIELRDKVTDYIFGNMIRQSMEDANKRLLESDDTEGIPLKRIHLDGLLPENPTNLVEEEPETLDEELDGLNIELGGIEFPTELEFFETDDGLEEIIEGVLNPDSALF
jgi:hypothetical protein